MERGKKTYLKQCAMCHGIQGDGNGFLAAAFDVKPRDFRGGTYKFRSTGSGELPAIADVERTIRVGVPGTTMPAWGQFLTAAEIADVARYLVVFSPRFVDAWRQRAAPQLLSTTAPPPHLTALASAGAAVYTRLQCAQCHGAGGHGNGPAAATLKDEWEQPIRAADLTYRWTFKNGDRPEDVYRTMVGGLNGTPMPSYGAMVPEEQDRWALVAYLLALSPVERPALHLKDFAAQRSTRIGPNGLVSSIARDQRAEAP
jgi:mono/diheme cytochrome c family protein